MRVLLTLTDLYKTIGGGQTVARSIIEQNPRINFTYLRVTEPVNARRPKNCTTVPFSSRRYLKPKTPPPHTRYELQALEEADAIARSVAGQSFDIVESPDFMSFGWALPAACAYHGVKVGRFVLALHGNLSKSVELNWGSAGDCTLELELLERRQFEHADGVYGISKRYIQEWQSRIPRDVAYIDPLHFVFAEPPVGPWQPNGKPSLYCIGRSERRKGNDLFVEFCRWLKPDGYKNLGHIGSPDFANGIDSKYYLTNMAKARGINIPYLPSHPPELLAALYRRPTLVVLPTRYDTLNLVALEALFSGCPIAVSSQTGVCDYLDADHSQIPYLKLDLNDFYSDVSKLNDLIENYDAYRARLYQALENNFQNLPQPNMVKLYTKFLDEPPKFQKVTQNAGAGISLDRINSHNESHFYEEERLSWKRRSLNLARQLAPASLKSALRPLIHKPRDQIITYLQNSGHLGDARYFSHLIDSQWVPHRLRDVGLRSERNQNALKEKLGTLYYYATNPLYRCNFWLDMARVERLRGEDLIAATYELRILRLLGSDKLGLLPKLTKTLESKGFHLEAEAARACYNDPVSAPETVYRLLKERFDRLRYYSPKDWDYMDDRRQNSPKVSLIVSLYNAEEKLYTFLSALSQQTLVKARQVEIILVDSGSPTSERTIFEAFHENTSLDIVFARSAKRETIQAAWNRGIKLARAPYLVFLGVDEILYPEALDVLASELDDHPDVDWVMANSIVTAVDESGSYKNDIMMYDRKGAWKDHTYLETCYLSWVGGMYRRSIHERFGYYDEAFRGAGDTEFKNRLLPHINVRYIDKMLGIFLNYPDGQTTASPMAEIEDSRAWYLFRSAGGVRYAFEYRPIEDAENLLKLCVGYRKSYCQHISTDIEYAALLADYLIERDPACKLANALASGLHELLNQFRGLELARSTPSRLEALQTMAKAWRTAKRLQTEHSALLKNSSNDPLHYQVMNDNRYEQHFWLWKSI